MPVTVVLIYKLPWAFYEYSLFFKRKKSSLLWKNILYWTIYVRKWLFTSTTQEKLPINWHDRKVQSLSLVNIIGKNKNIFHQSHVNNSSLATWSKSFIWGEVYNSSAFKSSSCASKQKRRALSRALLFYMIRCRLFHFSTWDVAMEHERGNIK